MNLERWRRIDLIENHTYLRELRENAEDLGVDTTDLKLSSWETAADWLFNIPETDFNSIVDTAEIDPEEIRMARNYDIINTMKQNITLSTLNKAIEENNIGWGRITRWNSVTTKIDDFSDKALINLFLKLGIPTPEEPEKTVDVELLVLKDEERKPDYGPIEVWDKKTLIESIYNEATLNKLKKVVYELDLDVPSPSRAGRSWRHAEALLEEISIDDLKKIYLNLKYVDRIKSYFRLDELTTEVTDEWNITLEKPFTRWNKARQWLSQLDYNDLVKLTMSVLFKEIRNTFDNQNDVVTVIEYLKKEEEEEEEDNYKILDNEIETLKQDKISWSKLNHFFTSHPVQLIQDTIYHEWVIDPDFHYFVESDDDYESKVETQTKGINEDEKKIYSIEAVAEDLLNSISSYVRKYKKYKLPYSLLKNKLQVPIEIIDDAVSYLLDEFNGDTRGIKFYIDDGDTPESVIDDAVIIEDLNSAESKNMLTEPLKQLNQKRTLNYNCKNCRSLNWVSIPSSTFDKKEFYDSEFQCKYCRTDMLGHLSFREDGAFLFSVELSKEVIESDKPSTRLRFISYNFETNLNESKHHFEGLVDHIRKFVANTPVEFKPSVIKEENFAKYSQTFKKPNSDLTVTIGVTYKNSMVHSKISFKGGLIEDAKDIQAVLSELQDEVTTLHKGRIILKLCLGCGAIIDKKSVVSGIYTCKSCGIEQIVP